MCIRHQTLKLIYLDLDLTQFYQFLLNSLFHFFHSSHSCTTTFPCCRAMMKFHSEVSTLTIDLSHIILSSFSTTRRVQCFQKNWIDASLALRPVGTCERVKVEIQSCLCCRSSTVSPQLMVVMAGVVISVMKSPLTKPTFYTVLYLVLCSALYFSCDLSACERWLKIL